MNSRAQLSSMVKPGGEPTGGMEYWLEMRAKFSGNIWVDIKTLAGEMQAWIAFSLGPGQGPG
jgi:hypothetical protein